MSVWVKRALRQVLDEISGKYPDNLALIFKNQRISYRMLREKTRTLAKGLMVLGVGRGDKVSIWGGNCPEWIYTQMATALIGAVLVPVNTRFRTSELEYILSQSDSTTLVLMEMGSEMGRVGNWRSSRGSISSSPSSNRTFSFPESGFPIIFFQRLSQLLLGLLV
jgi:long-subunit acyl-CoA synthetase (AMP-forming)